MRLFIHIKFEESPRCLGPTYIATVNISLDLVVVETDVAAIVTLVNVLVKVLDTTTICTTLDVDVAVVFERQIRVVWHDISVVKVRRIAICIRLRFVKNNNLKNNRFLRFNSQH
jgi:hypothetical protein